VETTRHEQATVGDRPSDRQAELMTKTREDTLDILRVDQDSIDPTNQRLRDIRRRHMGPLTLRERGRKKEATNSGTVF
jgi:hypothetical protein